VEFLGEYVILRVTYSSFETKSEKSKTPRERAGPKAKTFEGVYFRRDAKERQAIESRQEVA